MSIPAAPKAKGDDMTDTTTSAVERLAKNTEITSGMIKMGERIHWGSETALMDQCAATLRAIAAERDALRAGLDRIKRGQWFYSADGYESESCFSSPYDVLEEVYFWDRTKSGVHLVEINVATPLPSIWAVVSFDCQCNIRDECDCADNMVVQQFSSKDEAEAAYRKARGL